MVLQGVKSKIFAEILPLHHAAGSQIFSLHDGNRPLAPILRQRWRSLLYDVYWLAGRWCLVGSKYLEYNPGSELNIYWWTWKLNNGIKSNIIIKWNTEQKLNKYE
jgi:hypothetical protein